MFKEFTIVIFLTAIALGILYTAFDISNTGRLIIGIGNGLFWGYYFSNKYGKKENDK